MPAQLVSPSRRPRTLSEWFRSRCRALPLVLGASILAGPWISALEAAGPNKWPGSPKLAPGNTRGVDRGLKPKKPTTPVEEVDAPLEDNKVKLNYISASWETVLRDVCEATGSELVADRVPSGRFSRRDGAEYTRAEALRIINHEIESNGFRVIEKGKFLVVIDLPSQRMQYAAPIIPKPTSELGKSDPVTPPVRPQRQTVQVTQRTPETETPAAPVTPAGGAVPQTANRVTQTSHEEPVPQAAAAPVETPRPLPQEPMTMVVFRARNQRSTELAKRVFRTFRDRAELVEMGRDGLPALRVRQTKDGPTSPIQFSMAIDEQREELLIDARQADSDALLKLLRRIDTASLDTEGIQLVSSTKPACLAAAQLPKEIAALRAARQEADPLAVAQVDQPAAPGPGGRERVQVVQPSLPLGDVLGNLKSEVTIESIPDLGVIILKGNEKDVEQVMQVIRELEKLSEGTAPKVHLLHLNNVNSDALAELLTSVFEKLTKFPGKATQPRQSVSIVAVSKPNAILIVAPANDLDSIIGLAEELDQPVQADTEFQIFQLQTAIATQLAEMLTEFYAERVSLGARIRVQAEPRTNTLIVQARPNDLDEVATLIKKIDREAEGSKSQMKVFVLKNAVASELAAIINAAIQSVMSPPSNPGASQIFGNQGGNNAQIAEQFREVRSTVLELLAIDKDGEKKLKSGILADVRITPDPRMNALMVAAPEASMSLIAELINLLDRPTNQVAEIKVFTLANADATLMVQQLQTLFGISATGGANQQRQGVQGIQVAGAEDASSGLIPLKFSVDPRTNSVIAIGAAEALRVVEAIMFRLDESDVRERQTSVFRLKNSPAAQIATAVQQFLTNQRDLTQQDPNLTSNVEALEREVIVVAEPVSNSLLISATPRYHRDVVELVKKLDEAPKQVVIQALLVEVELQDTDEFGIELGFQDSILFDRSLIGNLVQNTTTTTDPATGVQTSNQTIISQEASPGFLFGNPATPLGNNTASAAARPNLIGTQGLGSFSLGRTNNELGFGGLVLSASSESVSFLMRALAANRQVRVLSRPEIRTLDNQLAQIQQGQEVPVVTGVNQTQTSTGPQITRSTAGVILTVIPRISPDNQIVMELIAEKSQYNLNNGVPIFTDLETGNTITSPVKDISVARTTVSVPNGQTIVLAGMITDRIDEAHRKVPILGDIPLLGTMFRYDFQQNRRTELLMFLTPRVVLDDATSEFIKDVEMGRLHFNQAHAEEIHGPLHGVPAADGSPSPLPGTPMMPPAPPTPNVIPPVVPVVPTPGLPGAAAEATPLDLTLPPQPAAKNEVDPAFQDFDVTPAAYRRLSEPSKGRVVPASATQAPGVARPRVKLGRNTWDNK